MSNPRMVHAHERGVKWSFIYVCNYATRNRMFRREPANEEANEDAWRSFGKTLREIRSGSVTTGAVRKVHEGVFVS